MAATLLLDRSSWDVCIDSSGNIAVATEPYSQVQDVASACKLFRNDAYYAPDDGIPYFEQVLGQFQPVQVVKAFLVQAALTVPGVTSATAILSDIVGRELTGQVQIQTDTGATGVAVL